LKGEAPIELTGPGSGAYSTSNLTTPVARIGSNDHNWPALWDNSHNGSWECN